MSAEDEKKAAAGAPAVVRSDGADAAQGYAETEVPEGSRTPTVEMFRVQVTDPRRAPTMRRDDMLKGSGPRAPEQTAPPVARAPGVEAPMGRPATKMQPLRFDQEFLEELRQKRAQAANDEVPESEALAEAPPRGEETARATEEEDGAPRPASPWVKDAAAAPAETLDLPSSHAPPAMPEAVSPPAVSPPAGHGKGLALAGVVIGVAMFLALRAAVTRTGGDLPPAPVSTTATPSAAPSPAPIATETASTAPSATETTSTGVAAPEASTAAPVSTGHPPSPSKPPGALENPYDAAVVTPIPAATVAPTAPPTVAPIAPPTVAPIAPPPPSTAPKAPPTASSARPSPISTSGRIVGGEE